MTKLDMTWEELIRNIRLRMTMMGLNSFTELADVLGLTRQAFRARQRGEVTRRVVAWWSLVLQIPSTALIGTPQQVVSAPVDPEWRDHALSYYKRYSSATPYGYEMFVG